MVVSPLLNGVTLLPSRRELSDVCESIEGVPTPTWLLFRGTGDRIDPDGRMFICPLDSKSTRIVVPGSLNEIFPNDEEVLPTDSRFFNGVRLRWNEQNNEAKTKEVQVLYMSPTGLSVVSRPVYERDLRTSGIRIPGTQKSIRYKSLDPLTNRIIRESTQHKVMRV